MKIIITGATGFIGHAIAKTLLAQKHQVYAIIRPHTDTHKLPKGIATFIDNSDTKALTHFFEETQADGILHLASLILVNHKAEYIESLILSNILFSTRLLEASVKSNVQWFINTGTFWQHYEDEDYNPVNLYAATKQAFEDIAKYYYETKNINFVTIKLNDTFGAEDTRSKIFNLWGKAVKNNENLGMSGGEQIIDISYIENILDAYMQMIKLLREDENFNFKGKVFAVTAKERMSLKDLAKLYEKVTKTSVDITWGGRPYREREVMTPWTKGKPVPHWEQKINLEDAIKKVMHKDES